MKKIFNPHTYISLLALGMLLLIAGGCKKTNTSENLSTPRLFKPGGLTVKAGQTSANVTWTAPLFSTASQKVTYTAQFSKDTTFATVDFTLTSDTLGVTATDDKLTVRQNYWVRVKSNATGDQAESKWIESSKFSITGTQLFQPVRELEIQETSVTLRFTPTTGLAKITLTPATGTPINVTLSAGDAAAGLKVITGLTPNTAYSAELFDTKSKGYLTFTTLPLTVYTVTLSSGGDLAGAIAAAGNNAVIGLNPGTYNLTASATAILQKTITIKSTSNNPADTKVLVKELTLKGTGAGIKVAGIEFDGAAPGNAAYFINLTGATADGDAAVFTSITIDNCVIHNIVNCLVRANRATTALTQKIDFIKVNNTVVYDNAVSTYDFFTLDKLVYNRLDVTQSTFYNLSRSLVNCPTVLTGNPAPTVVFNKCTINNMGTDAGKYVILDANSNPVNFTFTNNIMANIPRIAGVNAAAVRASASTITFTNNNFFDFVTTLGGSTVVALPATAANNKSVDLGWTATTNDFTLPVSSELRISSTTGGAIGDPRWAY